MRYRALGSTGIEVSIVGFGASPFGNVYGTVPVEGDDAVVGSAIDAGINFFDVSPYYGETVAESRLGAALRGRRTGIYLATKCGRYGVDRFDFSAASITNGLEASLQRLQTDHVDVLQAHDVEFGSFEQIVDETIPAMQRLRDQGKVRWIGVTGYWPGNLARLLQKAELDVVLNYCHGNLFADDLSTELLPFATERNVGVLNASPLHMGLLGNQPVPPWHPAPATVRAAAECVVALCRDRGSDAARLALQYCLRDDAVASTFVGISSTAQTDAASLAVDEPIDPELLSLTKAILAPVQNLTWSSGRPENAAMRAETTTAQTREASPADGIVA